MTDTTQKKKKSKKHQPKSEDELEEEEIDQSKLNDDYIVKPSHEKAKCDTSSWPLLLKVISFSILKITLNCPEL